MAETIEFNQWLVQPGNHRLLTLIRKKLQPLLSRAINIESWPDLYMAFEESVDKNEQNREIFQPVFEQYPPTPETGATTRQMILYRGAIANPDALPQARAETIEVTYRGRTITKNRSEASQSHDNPGKLQGGKPRYYRGARID